MAKKVNTDYPEYINQSYITMLIDKINEAGGDVDLDWNSFGGSVYAGQRFADYLGDRKFKTNANITGIAASMGAVLIPFFSSAKGAKQADIMIHSMTGDAPLSTWQHTNEFLYGALAKKINEAKFKEVTGKELKEVMLGESRIDIWLTGEQAGYIGLLDETYDLLDKAAQLTLKQNELEYELPENLKIKYGLKNDQIKNEMEVKDVTVELLKTGNLAVYNAIMDAGKRAEKERVAEIMEYGKYDMDKANELINSGKELSKSDVAYFIEKKMNAGKVADLETNSQQPVVPAQTPRTAPEKKREAEIKAEKNAILEANGFKLSELCQE